MEALTTMALSKAVNTKSKEAKAARAEMSVGSHNVDVTVRLKGVVTVGSDTSKASTNTLLNQEFLQLVLYNAGVTRNAAIEIVSRVAEEYMMCWDGSEEGKKEAKKTRQAVVKQFDPEGKIAAIFNKAKDRLPRTHVKGAVKFKGTVEEVFDSVSSDDELPVVSIKSNTDIEKVS